MMAESRVSRARRSAVVWSQSPHAPAVVSDGVAARADGQYLGLGALGLRLQALLHDVQDAAHAAILANFGGAPTRVAFEHDPKRRTRGKIEPHPYLLIRTLRLPQ